MRILVVVDEITAAPELVSAVARLAGLDDEVHMLEVIPPREVRETVSATGGRVRLEPQSVGLPSGRPIPGRIQVRLPAESRIQAAERVTAEARAGLRVLVEDMMPDPSRVTVHARIGKDPVGIVLEEAVAIGAHGIAVGTRPAGGIRGLLGGSVAERLIRRAPVPVLVVTQDMAVLSIERTSSAAAPAVALKRAA